MSQPELLPKILEAWFEMDECKPCDRLGLKEKFDALIEEALALDDSVSRYELLAGGDSAEDLLEKFPDLERDDILACHEFSWRMLAARSVHLALQ